MKKGVAFGPCRGSPAAPPVPRSSCRKEITTLQLKLLRTNAELKLKQTYASRLEVLLRSRAEKIDALTGVIDQLRSANQRLEEECEHLADMIRIMPQLDPAMLAPK